MTAPQRPDRTYGHPRALRPAGHLTAGVYAVHLIVDGSASDHAWGRIAVTPIAASGLNARPRGLEAAGPLSDGAWIPPCLRVAGQNEFDEER